MPLEMEQPYNSTSVCQTTYSKIHDMRVDLNATQGMKIEITPKSGEAFAVYVLLSLGSTLAMCGGLGCMIAGVALCLSPFPFLAYNTGELKCRCLRHILDRARELNSPSTVPLMLDMVNHYYDDAISVSVWKTLDNLLPRVTEEHLPYFTTASVTRLNSYLNRSGGRQMCLRPIAVVRCLEVVGNEESVQAMQVALHAEPYLRGRDWEGLCEVIQEVLPRLRLRLKTVREEQSLLRPSQAPDEKALLLRPSHESTVPAEELLRSASKKGAG